VEAGAVADEEVEAEAGGEAVHYMISDNNEGFDTHEIEIA
jgi:hypothetical protein